MKNKSEAGLISPFWVVVFAVCAFCFAAISGSLWLLTQGMTVDDLFRIEPTDMMSRINPDVTQIPETTVAITPENASDIATFHVILASVNQARSEAGLQPVTLNPKLSRAAAQQARYTGTQRRVTHRDANGNEVNERVELLGYEWSILAENLLANWTIEGVPTFQQWQDSPPHNANMMRRDITEMGLAYYVTSFGQVYHAMVLASPE